MRGDGAEGRGEGRIITMVGDFGEPAPPQKDLGASPLNSLNLVVFFPRLSSDLPIVLRVRGHVEINVVIIVNVRCTYVW